MLQTKKTPVVSARFLLAIRRDPSDSADSEARTAACLAPGLHPQDVLIMGNTHGKSPFLMGKSTIKGVLSIATLNYQRVSIGQLESLVYHIMDWLIEST